MTQPASREPRSEPFDIVADLDGEDASREPRSDCEACARGDRDTHTQHIVRGASREPRSGEPRTEAGRRLLAAYSVDPLMVTAIENEAASPDPDLRLDQQRWSGNADYRDGWRDGHASASPDPDLREALDVERLAMAMHALHPASIVIECERHDRIEATEITREYAILSRTEASDE